MARLEVKFTDHKGEDQSARAEGTVQVFTPAGKVFVSYDSVSGMATVVVRGEKGSTMVKFNEKAVV